MREAINNFICKLEENSKINGQQYTGGLWSESNAVVIIDDCSEKKCIC